MEKENIHQFKRHQRDGVDECVLLCIDQHAADERVRLEQMEIEIFGVDGTERNIEFEEFSTPKLLRCNAREVEVLSTFESDIKAWGFDFEISGTRDEENKYCGFVKSTNCESLVYLYSSPRVDTRVANEHDFREYIQMLSEQENFWLSNTVMRPPIVTRLLNSRACRGAIMFGDKLSFDDCKNLLDQLSRCRLPFQCAHGRPSIVPLVQFSDKRDSMSS
jgi:DNA mismatch repair protein MLH3